jgi:hypothetical protein
MKQFFLISALVILGALSTNAQQNFDDVYDYHSTTPQYGNSTTGQGNQSNTSQQSYYYDDARSGSNVMLDYNDEDYFYSSYIMRFYRPFGGFGYFSNIYYDPFAWGWGNSWSSWSNPYYNTWNLGYNNTFVNYGYNPWLFWNNGFNTSWGWNNWGYNNYQNTCWGNNFFVGNTCYNNWNYNSYYHCGNSWNSFNNWNNNNWACGSGYNNMFYNGYNNGYYSGYNNGYYDGYNNGYYTGNNLGTGNNGNSGYYNYNHGPRKSSYTFSNLDKYESTRSIVTRPLNGAEKGGSSIGGVVPTPVGGRTFNDYGATQAGRQLPGRSEVGTDTRTNTTPVLPGMGKPRTSNGETGRPAGAVTRPSVDVNQGGLPARGSQVDPRVEAPRQERPVYQAPPVRQQSAPRQMDRNLQAPARQESAPRQERPSYRAPARQESAPRQERPSYQAPARQESAPRQERPSYQAPARQESAPRQERPSYQAPARQESAPRQERPSYQAPARQESAPRQERPSYQAPARQESAPRQERPSYQAPARQESAPRQERPSYQAPARQEAPSRSSNSDGGGSRSFGRR